MLKKIDRIRLELANEILDSSASREDYRVRYLGSKGLLKELYQEFKSVASEEKREIGLALNFNYPGVSLFRSSALLLDQ